MTLTFRPTQPLDVAAVFPPALLEQQLKVDPAGAEATLITALARAACGWVERYTSTSLLVRPWVMTLDAFSPVVSIPIGPLRTVTAVSYRDPNGAPQNMETSAWFVSGADVKPSIPRCWPGGSTDVTISFTAGYDDPATEAPALVAASLMMLTHMWRNREGQGDPATIGAPAAVLALCNLDRTPVLA